jgi:hypothetical protein
MEKRRGVRWMPIHDWRRSAATENTVLGFRIDRFEHGQPAQTDHRSMA